MKKFNLDDLIELRHWFHKNAELSLKEFKTSGRIKEELLKLGIRESEIQAKANTGLQVDLQGSGKPVAKSKIICLRADMDALPIKENNPNICNIFV